jgi:TPR repeat protein
MKSIIKLLALSVLLILIACGNAPRVDEGIGSSIKDNVVNVIEYMDTELCKLLSAEKCYDKADKMLKKNTELSAVFALTIFVESCDKGSKKGSPAACEQAGFIYQRDKSSADNPVKAIDYFVKACTIDQRTGCFQAAQAYKGGDVDTAVVKQDTDKAIQFFTRACNNLDSDEANKAKACTQVGLLLVEKSLVEEGQQGSEVTYQGFEFFSLACTQNDGEGCFQLGQSYRLGRGVAASEDQAKQYYNLGCDGKIAQSCLWAGHLSAATDPQIATQYYFVGCSYGNPDACFSLAERYREGIGVTRDLSSAEKTYQQICSDTIPLACYWYAWLLQQKVGSSANQETIDRVDTIVSAYQNACGANIGLACYQLALITQTAILVDADPPQLAQYLTRSCELSTPLGCYELAILYQTGNGVPIDHQQASDLYKSVCEANTGALGAKYLKRETMAIVAKDQWQRVACWQLGQSLLDYPQNTTQNVYQDTANASTTAVETLEKDSQQAVIYLRRSCQLDWPPACLIYALAADNGIGITQNTAIAYTYYAKTCDLNQTDSLQSLSMSVGKTLPHNDLDDLVISSIAEACYNLGVSYRDAIGVEKNLLKAKALFSQSCELEQPRACYNYALAIGDGDESQQYIRRACQLGLYTACALLPVPN